jgi:hypothetical protein
MESRGKRVDLQAGSKKIRLFMTVCTSPQNIPSPVPTARAREQAIIQYLKSSFAFF